MGLTSGAISRTNNSGGPLMLVAQIPNIPPQSTLGGLSVLGSLAPLVAHPFLSITAPALGAASVDIFTFQSGDTFRPLVSLIPQIPTGSGSVFGIGPDALGQLFAPIIFGPVGPTGTIHLGFTGLPALLSLDAVALGVTPLFTLSGASNPVTFTTS